MANRQCIGVSVVTPTDYTWLSASGERRLREKVEPLLDFELDKFQVQCPARILDGQDVLCIASTGSSKSAIIYVPLMVREGTISIVVSPTNFLQRDMVRKLLQLTSVSGISRL
jgi:ATP-dependent helicase YprA (DUF1998 family)